MKLITIHPGHVSIRNSVRVDGTLRGSAGLKSSSRCTTASETEESLILFALTWSSGEAAARCGGNRHQCGLRKTGVNN